MSQEPAVNQSGGGVEIEGRVYFGMDAETAVRQQSKRDGVLEKALWTWIEDALNEKLTGSDLVDALRDGRVLCRLVNRIEPGRIKIINEKDTVLHQEENIRFYLAACQGFGMPSQSLFVASDLTTRRSVVEVVRNVETLARYAVSTPNWNGPAWDGPKFTRERPHKPSTRTPLLISRYENARDGRIELDADVEEGRLREIQTSALRRFNEYTVRGKILCVCTLVLGVYVVLFHIAAFVLESVAIESAFAAQLLGTVSNVTLFRNQGIYNACLAALNLFAIVSTISSFAATSSVGVDGCFRLRISSLLFVGVVGIAGGVTVAPLVGVLQAAPALVALLGVLLELQFVARR